MSKKILEILIEEKLLDETKREIALQRQIKMGGKIGGHLLALGFINPRQLAQALSKRLNIPEVDPDVLKQIDKKLINEFPIHLAKKYIALPLIKIKDTLSVAIADPKNKEAEIAIAGQMGYRVRFFVAPESLIKEMIIKYYKIDKSYLLPDDPLRDLTRAEVLPDQEMFDYSQASDIDDYIPGHEIILTPDEDLPENLYQSIIKQEYKFIAAPKDPFVLSLTQVKSMESYAQQIVNTLFLGLDRLIVFELYSDHIEHVASKNWIHEKDRNSFKITSKSINFYLLLQESFFYGPIKNILSPEIVDFLLRENVVEPDKYNCILLALNYGNSPLYLVYGDLDGQKIPEKYCQTWKSMQPKFEEALEYLVSYFDIGKFL